MELQRDYGSCLPLEVSWITFNKPLELCTPSHRRPSTFLPVLLLFLLPPPPPPSPSPLPPPPPPHPHSPSLPPPSPSPPAAAGPTPSRTRRRRLPPGGHNAQAHCARFVLVVKKRGRRWKWRRFSSLCEDCTPFHVACLFLTEPIPPYPQSTNSGSSARALPKALPPLPLQDFVTLRTSFDHRRRRILRRGLCEPMAPLRTVFTRFHAPSFPIALVPPLNAQDRKQHLRSMAIYTGVRVKEDDVEDWFAGNLNTMQLLEGAKVKTGHAGDWTVRRGGYRKCEGGKDIIIWLCTYEADERILAEAAIHNTYIAMGAPRIVGTCLGARCCVKHREFFSLAKIGGLRAMDRTIRAVLSHLGQTHVHRNFIPAPLGFEDLHRELRSAWMRR
ncbi:hypothetical protein B0H13DRAFT_2533545 [Mycena leptocephala]|nr:hypothetical protein B0H13DRAFT_2533545 [Mycena leptocephala]